MPDRELPDGWRVVRLGDVADVRRDPFDPRNGTSLPYVALEHIEQGFARLRGWAKSGSSVSTKTRFQTGDVLFGKLRPHLRKGVRAPFDGVCSTDILALFPKEGLRAEYLGQLVHWRPVEEYAIRTSIGTKMPRTTWPALARYRLPLPPLGEQARIAEVLDGIDAAVEKTEGVIAATERLRSALLGELLTRGVPGWHTEWKDVPGIGTMPACWEVVRLGEVAEVQTGRQVGKPPGNGKTVTMPYLSVANVKDGYLHLDTVKTMEIGQAEITRFSLRAGDVLFTEGGDADKLGRGCLWNAEMDPCLHQNHVFAVRPRPAQLLPAFLAGYARSPRGKRYFLGCAKQTTNLASINSTQLKAMPLPLPPVGEQVAIQSALDLVERRRQFEVEQLETLRTAKQACASALLSGRVRVRQALEIPND